MNARTVFNQTLQLSAAGKLNLLKTEGHAADYGYYHDQANNCTYGYGILAHHGTCTSAELKLVVTQTQAEIAFIQHVQATVMAVRRSVKNQALSQAQFDALVSFCYNVGASASKEILSYADQGQFQSVAQQMRRYIYIHKCLDGKRSQAIYSNGLVSRRNRESAPFQMD